MIGCVFLAVTCRSFGLTISTTLRILVPRFSSSSKIMPDTAHHDVELVPVGHVNFTQKTLQRDCQRERVATKKIFKPLLQELNSRRLDNMSVVTIPLSIIAFILSLLILRLERREWKEKGAKDKVALLEKSAISATLFWEQSLRLLPSSGLSTVSIIPA